MTAPAAHLREAICPHGTHPAFAAREALIALLAMGREQRERVLRAVCERAEIASLRSSVVNHWEESLLRLRVDGVVVLYTVDRDGALLVHHLLRGEPG